MSDDSALTDSEKTYADTEARSAIVLSAGYLFILTAANLTVQKTVELVPGYPIPVGSLLFALNYTWSDLLGRVLGKRLARITTLVGAAFQVLMACWLYFYLAVPGSQSWVADPTGQRSIALVFGAVPRVVVAGIFAALIVENVDITVFFGVRRRFPLVPRWLAMAASNTVSAPLDGALFAVLAFSGNLPMAVLLRIVITSAIYKLAMGYVSLPLSRLVGRNVRDRSIAQEQTQ